MVPQRGEKYEPSLDFTNLQIYVIMQYICNDISYTYMTYNIYVITSIYDVEIQHSIIITIFKPKYFLTRKFYIGYIKITKNFI